MEQDLHPIFAQNARYSAEDMRRYTQVTLIREVKQDLEFFAKNIVPEPHWQKFQNGLRSAYFLLGDNHTDAQIVKELGVQDIETLQSYMMGQAKPDTPRDAAALCYTMSDMLRQKEAQLFLDAFRAQEMRSAHAEIFRPA